MAAGIAHELNNPLTSVTGFAELALDETPQRQRNHKDIEMVLREALRARRCGPQIARFCAPE
jgi:signal transduction histidine kinase